MTRARRNQLVLGLLGVVLAVVAYRAWLETSAAPSATSNDKKATVGGQRAAGAESVPTLDVHLDALDAERPEPGATDRDLFRFKPKAPPPAPAQSPTRPSESAPPAPAGPPQPPPIALKFLGLMQQDGGKPDLAILSDGVGPPMFGYVGGPPVAGRYRVLRVSSESVEIAYLDGSGRTTIRMNGQ
ncbi:MAG TPA: hypothetical protein VGJ29_00505 [Vicinamibacterales bacterium]